MPTAIFPDALDKILAPQRRVAWAGEHKKREEKRDLLKRDEDDSTEGQDDE